MIHAKDNCLDLTFSEEIVLTLMKKIEKETFAE